MNQFINLGNCYLNLDAVECLETAVGTGLDVVHFKSGKVRNLSKMEAEELQDSLKGPVSEWNRLEGMFVEREAIIKTIQDI